MAASLVAAVISFAAGSATADQVVPCLVGGPHCTTDFQTQPADAQNGKIITSVAGNPSGAPVKVKVASVLDPLSPQSGVTVTLTPTPATSAISGNTAVTDATGVATFPALTIGAEGRWTLTASTPGASSTTSNQFTTYDVATTCTTGTTCTASASNGAGVDVTATISNPPANGALLLSEGLDSVSCGSPAEGVATVDSTYDSSTGTKTITMRIDKALVRSEDPNDPGAAHYGICYQHDVTVPTGQLLPDCGTAPCISHRNKNQAGDAIITILLPLGDPKFGYCVSGSICSPV